MSTITGSAPFSTADLIDANRGTMVSCHTQFERFGGRNAFCGPVATIRCFEDNGLVRAKVGEPGRGRVLVVDGAGSLRTALVGDTIGRTAAENGWSGIVVHGAVRDVLGLAALDLGVKALGTNPSRPARAGTGEADVPLAFGNAVFTPGAWLFSDADGIVVGGPEQPT